MRLYRICQLEYLENFDGYGASYGNGGRWNRAGIPVLYFAESASVAMLEMANYLPSPRLIPATYRLGIYEIAQDTPMKRLLVEKLPADWNSFPHPQWTQRKGTEWLIHGKESVLAVPSVAVPGGLENIVLVSPPRIAATRIRLIRALEDIYDWRAFAQQ